MSTENGNGKKKWLRGKERRDDSMASKCVHLSPELIVNATGQRVELPATIATPGGEKRMGVMMQVVGTPQLGLLCRSERMRAAEVAGLPEQVIPQVKIIATSLDVCRMCPYWERPQ